MKQCSRLENISKCIGLFRTDIDGLNQRIRNLEQELADAKSKYGQVD